MMRWDEGFVFPGISSRVIFGHGTIPHTAGFNAVAVPDKLAGVVEIFGSVGPGLWHFAKGLSAPLALRDLGLTLEDLDKAAQVAVANPYVNPRL